MQNLSPTRLTGTLGMGPICILTRFPSDPILGKARGPLPDRTSIIPSLCLTASRVTHLVPFVDLEFSSLKKLLCCCCQFLIIIPLLHSASSHHHNSLSPSFFLSLIHTCACTYTHTYIHMRTHAHTYIHTYI